MNEQRLRPHTIRDVDLDGGEVNRCEFCKLSVVDQSLISWEMCCPEFEMTLEIERLRSIVGHPLIQATIHMNALQLPELLDIKDTSR